MRNNASSAAVAARLVTVVLISSLLISEFSVDMFVGEAAAQPPMRHLILLSEPSGAAVYVDSRLMGTTPYSGRLAAGNYQIRVFLEGHIPWLNQVDLRDDRRLLVDLRRGAVSRDRKWFWTLFGAVVAGGAAIAAFVIIRNRVSGASTATGGELPGAPPSPP